MRKTGWLVSILAGIAMASAVDAKKLDDLVFEDEIILPGSDVRLQLNGVGYRTKFVFDIYAGALYTTEKVGSRDAALALSGPNRVEMRFVYDEVDQEKLRAAWSEGFEENNDADSLARLRSRIDRFNALFPTLHAGDAVLLDFYPGKGTQITINGEIRGVIPGRDFNRALLDIWLGEEPADDDLKEAMLGEDDD